MTQNDNHSREPAAETGAEQTGKHALQHIPIIGRFDQYRSSYWAAAVAVLPIRYMLRPFFREKWENGNKTAASLAKHTYSALTGFFMEGVTAYYAYSTWKDMRSIFSQALAWEFDKDLKDISFSDFRNSKNTIVQQTIGNYTRYNLRRVGVNATFFLPFILKPFSRTHTWHAETGVDMGVAANAAYLFTDVISRKSTPFEALQSTIDRKINHAESFADQIEPADLLNIYERHATNGTIGSFLGQRGTPKWDHSMALFTRMANLMNQTYHKILPKEQADFSIPKFIYLVGHNLIQPGKVEQAMAYIEVANRYGIPALKEVVTDMQSGKDMRQALQRYPVTLPGTPAVGAPEEAGKKFTDKILASQAMTAPPGAYTDKTTMDKNANLGAAI